MKILTGTINELLNEVKAENNTNNSLQVESEVKSIIEKVKKDGDQALFDFTSQFDGVRLTELRVQTADIQSAS
ncbi:histidinol dehydrogenase, partial [Listeria monocytogenes]|nr:histidinol dehydrogenase [Listeria monocytogenes]